MSHLHRPIVSRVAQGFFHAGRTSRPGAAPARGCTPLPAQFGPLDAGEPLPDEVRRRMEDVLGCDLSNVRIHVGPEAARLGARAFTVGDDICFAPGQFDPYTPDGQRLIGHELAHVAQQRSGRARNTSSATVVALLHDPVLEAEAEHVGFRAVAAFRGTENVRLGPAMAWTPTAKRHLLRAFGVRGGVVQRYAALGGFAGGWMAADLLTVWNGLSRAAKAVMEYYDNDPDTDLVFDTGAVVGNIAYTFMEARIGGTGYELDQLCDPNDHVHYPLGLSLDADTRVRVRIVVDPLQHAPTPGETSLFTTTLIHEITIHAVLLKPWLQKLRSRAFNGVQIRSEYRKSNDQGLLDGDKQHHSLAHGLNRGYNQTAQNVFANLGPPVNAPFQQDVHDDMDIFLPVGVPRIGQYPI